MWNAPCQIEQTLLLCPPLPFEPGGGRGCRLLTSGFRQKKIFDLAPPLPKELSLLKLQSSTSKLLHLPGNKENIKANSEELKEVAMVKTFNRLKRNSTSTTNPELSISMNFSILITIVGLTREQKEIAIAAELSSTILLRWGFPLRKWEIDKIYASRLIFWRFYCLGLSAIFFDEKCCAPESFCFL